MLRVLSAVGVQFVVGLYLVDCSGFFFPLKSERNVAGNFMGIGVI